MNYKIGDTRVPSRHK